MHSDLIVHPGIVSTLRQAMYIYVADDVGRHHHAPQSYRHDHNLRVWGLTRSRRLPILCVHLPKGD